MHQSLACQYPHTPPRELEGHLTFSSQSITNAPQWTTGEVHFLVNKIYRCFRGSEGGILVVCIIVSMVFL